MNQELRNQIRAEKLAAMIKMRLLDFPTMTRGDVHTIWRNYSLAEIEHAAELLAKSGFITIKTGRRGGKWYARVI